MKEQQPVEEFVLEPRFMTKKELIRAYKYGSLNSGIVIDSNDYKWFNKHIESIKHKIAKKHPNGKAKRGYTPREVKFIFDLLLPPTVTK